MAIVIPSSKTYDKQNPKVRDNVIERIEVKAQEVVPNNEYEVSVYNEKFIVNESTLIEINEPNDNENTKTLSRKVSGGSYTAYLASLAYVAFEKKKNYDISVYIKKLKNNKYISELLLGKDEEGKPNIKYSIYGVIKQCTATTNATLNWGASTASGTVSLDKIEHTELSTSQNQLLDIPKTLSIETIDDPTLGGSSANVGLTDTGNVGDIIIATDETIDGIEYYKLTLSVMCALRTVELNGYNAAPSEFTSLQLDGVSYDYMPSQIEITIYGNTIGIDLTDKTVYIPENDKTSKKVHSVDGNELMQATNYILEETTGVQNNSIEKMYGDTQDLYSLGKETATIRCSIADYYENDTKVISIDKQRELSTDIATARASLLNRVYYVRVTLQQAFKNDINGKITWLNDVGYKIEREFTILASSTVIYMQAGLYKPTNINIESLSIETRMCFEIGDEVIPMVYGADGKDRPMSLYSNGSAKVFQVLGTRIFYDGAVWQELYLQEVMQKGV